MTGSSKLKLAGATIGLAAIIGLSWVFLTASVDPGPPAITNFDALDVAVSARIRKLITGVENSPRDAVRRGKLGMAYQANNVRQAALTSFQQAILLDSSEPKWWYYLAVTRSQLGDIDGAISALDEVISRNDQYVPVHWRRGQLLKAQGDWDMAEKAFRRALEINPNEPAALVGMTQIKLQKKNPREALTYLKQLMRILPNQPFLYQLLGQTYQQAGMHEKARLALARGKPDKPQWKDAWLIELDQYRVGFSAQFKKALRLIDAGQLPQAIALLESLRKQRPNDVTLLNNLGAAYIETGNFSTAIRRLEDALVDHPNHFGTHLNLSSAHEKLGQFDRALLHVEWAIRYNPTLARAHLIHGKLLMNMDRSDEAIVAFALAQKFDAYDIQSLVLSGQIECLRQRWAEALPFYEKAIERDSTDVEAFCGLALASMELGQLDKAQQALEKAKRLNPNDPFYLQVKRRFDNLRR
ncbi:MAG: tetratricopeptide repeat protein [Planctomycetes bacterium]|nr:tetratricopeptide repeat protein [Planctomycetota bacterium]